MAKLNSIEDKGVLSFILEKNGSLSDVLIVRNIGGAKAVRLVQSMPKWSPGKQGEPVQVANAV